LDSPPPHEENADHIVEFDLPLPSGRMVLEGSGGSGLVEINVQPDRYRARLSGLDFDAASAWHYDDTGYPADRYRLELWRTVSPSQPTESRRWAGYASRTSPKLG
jgi:hypothetical protein